MKTIEINGVSEQIIERSDYPVERQRAILGDEVTAILGYGPQGRGQSLNLRDQGFNVLVGVRPGRSMERALADGWEEGENLLSIEDAAEQGSIVQYLLSDAAQIAMWPEVSRRLRPGECLYFSHGFGIVFHEDTGIVPPESVDVVMVAPKGSGLTVRNHFLEGRGINASFAVWRDATGRARDRALATAFGIGSGHVFETTFEHEVYSDLTGERSVLMGLIQGAFKAQYDVLRAHGHSPSEAYNETVEEALQSLYPLIGDRGMDWMYANCSTTAQRGALDWAPRFEAAIRPLIEECYASVVRGDEARTVIRANSDADYRGRLEVELRTMASQELWEAGRILREFRPERQPAAADGRA
jgi:ketol-acid reductoisomerase